MYLISKEFDFSYAHRVWNQELTGNQICKCRHLHGHNGQLIIEFRAPDLANDMVIDYNELGFIKSFVDIYLDHKLILDFNDPMAPHFNLKFVLGSECNGFTRITPFEEPRSAEEKELYDSIILFKGVPTSENMAKAIFDGVGSRMSEFGIGVNQVTFKETHKTAAIYRR